MLRVGERLPDYKLDPPDDDEVERCEECCERFPCKCMWADSWNDEHWGDE